MHAINSYQKGSPCATDCTLVHGSLVRRVIQITRLLVVSGSPSCQAPGSNRLCLLKQRNLAGPPKCEVGILIDEKVLICYEKSQRILNLFAKTKETQPLHWRWKCGNKWRTRKQSSALLPANIGQLCAANMECWIKTRSRNLPARSWQLPVQSSKAGTICLSCFVEQDNCGSSILREQMFRISVYKFLKTLSFMT